MKKDCVSYSLSMIDYKLFYNDNVFFIPDDLYVNFWGRFDIYFKNYLDPFFYDLLLKNIDLNYKNWNYEVVSNNDDGTENRVYFIHKRIDLSDCCDKFIVYKDCFLGCFLEFFATVDDFKVGDVGIDVVSSFKVCFKSCDFIEKLENIKNILGG